MLLPLLAARYQLWTPANLGRDVLRAWWSAGDLADGAVASWTGRFGMILAQGTGANQPVRAATTLNGLPGVTFDGTNDLVTVLSVAGLPTGSTPGGILAVVSQDEAAGSANARWAVAYGGVGASTARALGRFPIGGVNRAYVGDLTVSHHDDTVDYSGVHIHAGEWSGTTMWGYIDGAPFATPSATIASLNTGTTRTTVGANSQNGLFWKGVVGEIFVWAGLLTTVQRNCLHGYAAWKYGLTSLLAANHPFKSRPPLLSDIGM